MATYGSRDKNLFMPSQLKGTKYYLLVESEGPNRGQITIKTPSLLPSNLGGNVNSDRTIGIIPLDNSFRPSGSINSFEREYFLSLAGQKDVKNHAVITAQKGGLPQQQARQLIFPNTAQSSSSPPVQSGTGTPPTPTSGQNPEGTPAPSESTEGSTSTEIGNKIDLPPPLTISPGPIKYPERMSDDQDKIYFQAVKLKSNDRKINENTSPNSLQFGFGVPEYELINDGPVVMAIQSSISDQNTVEWNPGSINAAEAALYNLSLGAMGTPTGQMGDAAKKTVDSMFEVAKLNEERIKRYVVGLAAGVNNILPRTDGLVLNPNLELLFQGPQLRPFNFQFKMSARDEQEAKNIKSIIKYFKYHMAVRKDERDLFLRAPHVFTIRYTKGNTENHPGINLISPSNVKRACALLNCSVDYTPLGSYMTYREGTMVSYNLSLQFQEITPIYNTDYEEEPGNTHPIGY